MSPASAGLFDVEFKKKVAGALHRPSRLASSASIAVSASLSPNFHEPPNQSSSPSSTKTSPWSSGPLLSPPGNPSLSSRGPRETYSRPLPSVSRTALLLTLTRNDAVVEDALRPYTASAMSHDIDVHIVFTSSEQGYPTSGTWDGARSVRYLSSEDAASTYSTGFIDLSRSSHFLLMSLYKTLGSTYERIWVIEEDTRAAGNVSLLWQHGEGADVITVEGIYPVERDHWTQATLVGPEGNASYFSAESRFHCSKQIYCLSSRALRYFDEAFSSGINGADEIVIATLANALAQQLRSSTEPLIMKSLKPYTAGGTFTWDPQQEPAARFEWESMRHASMPGSLRLFHPVGPALAAYSTKPLSSVASAPASTSSRAATRSVQAPVPMWVPSASLSDVSPRRVWSYEPLMSPFGSSRFLLRRLNASFVMTSNIYDADIVQAGTYISYENVTSYLQFGRMNNCMTFWITGEPHFGHEDYHLGLTDLSVGFRHELRAPNMVRWPFWADYLPTNNSDGFGYPVFYFPHELFNAWPSAETWARRPFGTAFINRHDSYPRKVLVEAFSSAHVQLLVGSFSAPSKSHNNMPWPEEHGKQLTKHEFLLRHRFVIAPENSCSDGYVTEKVYEALHAGCVPIYWGCEVPPEPDIFNPRRILFFNDTNIDNLIARAAELVSSATARTAFFGEPVLLPGASQQLSQYENALVEGYRSGWARFVNRSLLMRASLRLLTTACDSVFSEQLEASPDARHCTTEQLMVAISAGDHLAPSATYRIRGCRLWWFSRESACELLRALGGLRLIGGKGGQSEHLTLAMIELLSGDHMLATSAHLDSESAARCRCNHAYAWDGDSKDARFCRKRSIIHAGLRQTSAILNDLCPSWGGVDFLDKPGGVVVIFGNFTAFLLNPSSIDSAYDARTIDAVRPYRALFFSTLASVSHEVNGAAVAVFNAIVKARAESHRVYLFDAFSVAREETNTQRRSVAAAQLLLNLMASLEESKSGNLFAGQDTSNRLRMPKR